MTWKIMAGGPSPWGDQSKRLARLMLPEFEKGYRAYQREFGTVARRALYLEELYDTAPVRRVERLPLTVRWKKRGNPKDVLGGVVASLYVSKRLKALIEGFAPGVHDFYEIDLRHHASGEPWRERFHLWHMRNVLASVDDARSDIERAHSRHHGVAGGRMWSPSVKSDAALWRMVPEHRLVFRPEVIAGQAAWRDVGNLLRLSPPTPSPQRSARTGSKGWGHGGGRPR